MWGSDADTCLTVTIIVAPTPPSVCITLWSCPSRCGYEDCAKYLFVLPPSTWRQEHLKHLASVAARTAAVAGAAAGPVPPTRDGTTGGKPTGGQDVTD